MTFPIKYKFLAKEYACDGEITCTVEPNYEEDLFTRPPNKGESEGEFENVQAKIEYEVFE